MKIRVIPVIVTAVLTACLLVGGWYVYRNVSTVQPLERIAQDVPGVTAAKPVIGSDTVTLDVKLAPDADIRDVYQSIVQNGAAVIGSRGVKLNVLEEQGGKRLDDAWSSVLFQVAEAMDHRKYSEIPAAMKQVEKQFKGLEARSEIDDTNVYITLKDGNAAKHVVLPRTPDKIGVWPDA
ncbi:hypothetical protein [Paenibacillus humicola]|uniref:hypothetical protein n=1 Tax=Paenibacillus humicola TaxID=3110540 RepID=UPI00237ACCDD|nr:hypothetical protein [Paenibacillus humicola]